MFGNDAPDEVRLLKLRLLKRLNLVLLGQNLTSASSLMGRTISAPDDGGKQVEGPVSSVTITSGVPKLNVNNSAVSLNNIQNILN